MDKKNAFSLAEMMIVLLIVAVVMAASAPMISKRMIRSAEGESPWLFSGANGNITFNPGNNNNIHASIGAVNAPNGSGKLYIYTSGTIPQLSLGHGNGAVWHLFKNSNNSITLSNNVNASHGSGSVTIGQNANSGNGVTAGENSIALGSARANADSAIALGNSANSGVNAGANSIALGSSTRAINPNAIAIGNGARATSNSNASLSNNTTSVAIGHNTQANSESIAIGERSIANVQNAIAIGNSARAFSTNNNNATGAIAIGQGVNAYVGSQGSMSNSAYAGKNSIAIGNGATRAESENSIAIGFRANVFPGNAGCGDNSIAIGQRAWAAGDDSVAIGNYANNSDSNNASVPGDQSIAIGGNSKSLGDSSIAIGYNAHVNAYNGSISIGTNTFTNRKNSIAIGNGASTSSEGSIAIGNGVTNVSGINIGNVMIYDSTYKRITLGNENTTVYIPGNLVVGKKVYLGTAGTYATYVRLSDQWGDGTYKKLVTICGKHGERGDNGHAYIDDANTTYGEEDVTAQILKPLASDRRLKNVGDKFIGGLNEIKKLELYNFTYKKDEAKTPRVGVMAQDLQKIFPNAVTKGDDGFLRIRMEDMFYAAINAIKELDQKITALTVDVKNAIADITAMKSKQAEQEKTIAQLVEQNKQQQEQIDLLLKKVEKLEKKAK